MKDIKIIIAAHKPYKMPKGSMYLPVFVGAEGKAGIGFQPDNVGENISAQNPYFCELTGLYWAWKNLSNDYIGLAHYRRYFANKNIKKDKFLGLLDSKTASELLKKADIIVPKKRNYYIESLYSHYAHTLHIETLDVAGEIIKEKYPQYLSEFNNLKTRKSAHMFNMFVMKKELLSEYCTWLFNILFELKEKLDPKQYDSFHARYLGRVSELLFDVWLYTNGYNFSEVKVIDMEKVNWVKKGFSFLWAKFGGKKYKKSF